MKTATKIILANLAALAALLFIYPQFMVSPGPLKEGHHDLETDCFACHTVLLGATSAKCSECHKADEIGRLTTAGTPVAEPKTEATFHQELLEQDCVACHSDHRGVETLRTARRFSHSLLRAATREACGGCHEAPDDGNHSLMGEQCQQCHATSRWSPATFDHGRLEPSRLEQCADCHAAPDDTLHAKGADECRQCHETARWRPATFDHERYFRFDRDHDTDCATCHEGNDYRGYTCYGCHEHTPRNVRGEHLEEGIRDFEVCVDCHRSADEDEAEWRMRYGDSTPYRHGRERRYRGHDDDDDD